MFLLALTGLAAAYETDQLTAREVPLADSRPLANRAMDVLLREAIVETNAHTGCQASPERTHRVLAQTLRKRSTETRMVPSRGGVRRFGFQVFSHFLETDPRVERRAFENREDIFGDLTPWHSVILTYAGPASTVNVAGHDVGTDKFDHFLDFGQKALRKARYGKNPERGKRWSTRTERRFFGMVTSKTFSFADLKANWDGYGMYAGLLDPDGLVRRGTDGCLVQRRAWDWGAWVGWEWDEANNPPVFTRLVQKGVAQRLEDNPQTYCAAWEALGGPAYDAHLAAILDDPVPYGAGRMPRRTDPFQLGARCAISPSASTESPPQ